MKSLKLESEHSIFNRNYCIELQNEPKTEDRMILISNFNAILSNEL